VTCLKLPPSIVIYPKPPQYWEYLGRLVYVSTQCVRSAVGVFHLRRCLPFVGNQRRPQGDQQGKFVPDATGCVWELLDQRETFAEVRNCSHMRRALDSPLSRLWPVVDRLLCESCLRK
jgi:hypothetical protein